MNMIKYVMTAVAVACVTFAGVSRAETDLANSIEAINVARQGVEIAVKIDLKEALQSPPAGFGIANPAKIAFDFSSTANGLGKNSQIINEGDLRSVNVVQVGGRTRLVLNLIKNMNYATRLDGKSLYVTLTPIAGVGNSSAERVTRFSEESALGTRHSVQDIAFRRGKDGEARIVVDLSDSGAGIDIRQQGSLLVVEFVKTTIPDHLQRKLDVLDFGTPVTSIETRSKGENVKMTISPKGLWEHNAYQSDNQFIIEVKKIVEDANKLVQGSKIGYQGPRVSINYQNGDVRALLRLMAEELGLNAVISETVSGTTTLVLKEVPADQVVDIIFQQKGLDMRKNGNVILIAPRDELSTREKLEFESRQQVSELEPIRLESFQLNYQKAADIARLLLGSITSGAGATASASSSGSAPGNRILSKRGNVTSDAASNIVFVNDIPSKIDEIRQLIKKIDVGSRQVMIEARIVEANDTFNRDLGAKLSFTNTTSQRIGSSGVYVGGGSYSPSGQTSSQVVGVNLPSYTNVGGALTFSLFNSALSRILNLELAASEVDGVTKTISSPRIMTANNAKAKIEDGTEVPYVTPGTANSPPTVNFKSAKLFLEVTPQITPDGMIRMRLLVKNETPDWEKQIQDNPPIKSSIVETDVVVENGGTIVIGGVFLNNNVSQLEKVPFFGDLWGVGWLFKVQKRNSERRELLIFITPKVVNDRLNFN